MSFFTSILASNILEHSNKCKSKVSHEFSMVSQQDYRIPRLYLIIRLRLYVRIWLWWRGPIPRSLMVLEGVGLFPNLWWFMVENCYSKLWASIHNWCRRFSPESSTCNHWCNYKLGIAELIEKVRKISPHNNNKWIIYAKNYYHYAQKELWFKK